MHRWEDSSRMPSSYVLKTDALDGPLDFGGKVKSHTEQNQVNREVVPLRRYTSRLGREPPNSQGVENRDIVVVKMPRFVLPQPSSLLRY